MLGLAGTAVTQASELTPQPFTARYEVTYRGINAGSLRMAFKGDADSGNFVYETRAEPTFLARLVVSGDALERSVMEINADGVRPISWKLDDAKAGNKRDGTLHFDWHQKTVSGEIEGKSISLPAEPHLQDRLSVQIDVMTKLQRGQEPGTIPLIDDERIKQYSYTRGATGSLDTSLGPLETVIYESTRPGSKRVSRVWHAPRLGYLPVRAEQIRKGKVETVMVLKSMEGTSR
jgi:hypothetical protein